MNFYHFFILTSLILCLFISQEKAWATASTSVLNSELNIGFKTGDKICFIGDSITHGGQYHSIINLYYLTRFPKKRIKFYNLGISGDLTQNVLDRFDDDIASKKCNKSFIMLGMNDVQRDLYPDITGDKKAQQEEAFTLYQEKIALLYQTITSKKSTAHLIAPSIYDEIITSKKIPNIGVNQELERYSNFLKSFSAEQPDNPRVIDFYSPMLSTSQKIQANDTHFSLVGKDRIHPGYLGHFFMANEFLKTQFPQHTARSTIEIDIQSRKTLYAKNVSIKKMRKNKESYSFTYYPRSLPFPLSAIPKKTDFISLPKNFNHEILTIKNLAPKTYALYIDKQKIHTFTHTQLAEGINLTQFNTPQMQQAELVSRINEKRRMKELQLRNLMLVSSKALKNLTKKSNITEIQKTLDTSIKTMDGKPYQEYFKEIYSNYLENYTKAPEYNKQLKKLTRLTRKKSRPKKRFIKIIAIPESPSTRDNY